MSMSMAKVSEVDNDEMEQLATRCRGSAMHVALFGASVVLTHDVGLSPFSRQTNVAAGDAKRIEVEGHR